MGMLAMADVNDTDQGVQQIVVCTHKDRDYNPIYLKLPHRSPNASSFLGCAEDAVEPPNAPKGSAAAGAAGAALPQTDALLSSSPGAGCCCTGEGAPQTLG